MEQSEPLLACTDIHHAYRTGTETIHVLRGVNAQIGPAEFVVLLGPSGSGKSTLLFILGLMLRPDHGVLHAFGQPTANMDDVVASRLRNRELGFVFQRFNLFPRLNALRNVMWPLGLAGVPRARQQERALELLKRVGLEHRVHHYPHQLSAGEEQRVAIARALANDPQLVIADEPTGNLGGKAEEDVMQLFASAHTAGKSILLATHDHSLTEYATRVWRLENGRVVEG